MIKYNDLIIYKKVGEVLDDILGVLWIWFARAEEEGWSLVKWDGWKEHTRQVRWWIRGRASGWEVEERVRERERGKITKFKVCTKRQINGWCKSRQTHKAEWYGVLRCVLPMTMFPCLSSKALA
jgi:hypothetical protein